MEYSKGYRHLDSSAYDILHVVSPIPCLGCFCVGLLLRLRAVGWEYDLSGAAICCCDVVCWLQTNPGIVEVGTMFRYLKNNNMVSFSYQNEISNCTCLMCTGLLSLEGPELLGACAER
jgi:hypothetical protein